MAEKKTGCLTWAVAIIFGFLLIGYIASKIIPTTRKEPVQEKSPKIIYSKILCNIREGPGTNYSVIRKAKKGEKLEYIGISGNWYKLRVIAGKPQEWVHKSVISLSPIIKPSEEISYSPTIYITKSYFASPSKEILDKAVQYSVAHDEEALKQLMATGLLIILDSGIEVYIVDMKMFSGLVKIRPKGKTIELWTVHEAIERK